MLAAVNVGAMEPSTVHSIVDAFFEVKKIEVKRRLSLEMDRVVEDLFGDLVGQVKQLLVPGAKSCPPVVQHDHDVGKFTRALEPLPQSVQRFDTQVTDPPKPKSFANKSHATGTNGTLAKNISPSTIDSGICATIVPSQISLTKSNGNTKVESGKCGNEDEDEAQITVSPGKRVRVDSKPNSTDCNKKVKSSDSDQADCLNTADSISRGNQCQSSSANHKFVCQSPGCGKSFNRKFILTRHQRLHMNVKPYHCKWPNCSYASNDRSHTIDHIQSVHLRDMTKQAEQDDDGDPHTKTDPKVYLEVDEEALKS